MPNHSDILVSIDHPHGPVSVPLEEWMTKGPGERDLLKPVRASARSTGETLPLSVIPIQYRNSSFVRTLIKLRIMRSPWA